MSSKREPGQETKGLDDLRGTIAGELKDPYGKVNCYVGVVLLALLVLSVLRYFAGSVGIKIDLKWFSANLSDAGWREFLIILMMLLGNLIYWGFCLMSFAQVAPFRRNTRDPGTD